MYRIYFILFCFSAALAVQGQDDPFLQPPESGDLTPDGRQQTAKSVLDTDRLKQLAGTNSSIGYLKPLNSWNGPFQNRQKKANFEQDIIRQVGYAADIPKADNSPVFDWEKDEDKGFDWSVLDPANFAIKVRDFFGMGPDEKKAKAAMEKGRAILLNNPGLKDKDKNNEAAKYFKEAAKRFPDSVIEEDALHLAGECYFFADNYPKAMETYQKLLITYQHSKYLDNDVRRLFKIARYWEAESKRQWTAMQFSDKTLPKYDTFGFAKKCYETIFINDPNGPVSDDAVMALATAYLERGKYQGDDNYNQAAYYYHHLRENFPLSKHIAKAHENELFARTRGYMGADHPSKTLEEAGKLADITLQQFGNEINSETKTDIVEMKEGIINGKAEQLWRIGQFYDVKKRYYGSAKIYYEKIVEDYPQTAFAEKARRRLETIRDYPDVPPLFNFPNPFKRG